MRREHAVALALLWTTVAQAGPGDTELVSVNDASNLAEEGHLSLSAGTDRTLSGDGRFVVYQHGGDVRVRDRLAATTRVVAPDPPAIGFNWAQWPAISSDGRYVVFASAANDLTPDGENGYTDVFIQAWQTGERERVSVVLKPDWEAYGSHSDLASLSADGRFVAFQSANPALVEEDGNGGMDVFVRDREARDTQRIVFTGLPHHVGSDLGRFAPSISDDGRVVAYSILPWRTAEQPAPVEQVVLADRTTGASEIISLVPGGTMTANGLSRDPSVSGDGRFVAFTSQASNLVGGDTNGVQDVFVRDRDTGHTERISVSTGGTQGNGQSLQGSISADGRYVAFRSDASNLVTGDTNGAADVFVRDRLARTTSRVSVGPGGRQANRASRNPSISADGRFVAFETAASNLVANDLNGLVDVYVHELGSPEPLTVAYTVKPAALDFGVLAVGTQSMRRFVVRNKGTVPLTFDGVSLRGVDRSQFRVGNRCPATLGVDTYCIVRVTFQPTSAGAKTAKVRFEVGGSLRIRELAGVATAP